MKSDRTRGIRAELWLRVPVDDSIAARAALFELCAHRVVHRNLGDSKDAIALRAQGGSLQLGSEGWEKSMND